MSAETVRTKPPSTAGCGSCGGRDCGGCGGACECGAGAARAPSGGFARPRFFAGQLLNDDDLEAIETYVAGKNRLHNRFLHGDGVVCGLEVTCHPCGGGKVLVGGGYALDCCGNDIVVPCPEELDILEMIRELRIATAGGYDCGDPCARNDKAPGQAAGGPSQPAGEAGAGPEQPRRYWLYVRYAEQLSDPVAPYLTDEPCAAQSCEPTRIREGYQFVLRCHRTCGQDEDVLSRVLDCVGKPEELVSAVGTGRWARAFGARLRAALAALERAATPVSRSDFDRDEFTRLRSFVEAGQAPADEAAAGQRVDDLTAAAAILLRAKALSEADRTTAGLGDDLISDTSDLLRAATQKLRDQGVANLMDAEVRPFAEAGLRTAARAADQPAGQPLSGDMQLLIRGVAADNRLLTTTADGLRRQKAWLLDKVEHTRSPTDCGLAAEVAAVRIPVIQSKADESGEGAAEDPEAGNELAAAASRLALLTRRYLVACVCAAMNPPCPACTDDAVLLAGIDVLDCEVEHICQVVRRYVISGPNLRYWIPPLNTLPELLNRWCCTEELLRPALSKELGGKTPEPAAEPRFLAAERPAPPGATVRDRALLAIGDEFAGLAPAGHAGSLVVQGLSPTLLRADLADAAGRSPEVRAMVGSIAADALREQLGDVRADVRRELSQRESEASQQFGEMQTTIRQHLTELEQRLAEVTRLRDSLAQAQPPTPTPAQPPTPTPAQPAAPSGTGPGAEPVAEPKREQADRGTARRGGRGASQGGDHS